MNILFLTLLDFNSLYEQGIYTDLMKEFADNGHKLCIISPVEKRSNKLTELIKFEDVQILKLQIGNVQKTNIIEKGISMFTLESKFKTGIKKYFKDVKFDLVLYSTPPITLQSSVAYVKRRDSARTYLLLKDIFPQNALDLGMLSINGTKKYVYNYFKYKEKKLYEVSDYIGCMSKANIDFLLKQNPEIYHGKVEVCPNTITPVEKHIDKFERDRIRDKYGLPIDKSIFIYGGNLGKPQGIPFVLECVATFHNRKHEHILIVGSGTEYPKLKAYFDSQKPMNATLIESIPKDDYEMLVSVCNVGLIFLDNRFTIPNFPSRLLSYMQASLPVLAATDVNTDLGTILEKGQFGFWCQSGDLELFNTHVNALSNIDISKQMGLNGRRYLENHYTSKQAYNIITSHFK